MCIIELQVSKLNNTKTINYIYQQLYNNTGLCKYTILRYPYFSHNVLIGSAFEGGGKGSLFFLKH